MILTHFSFTAKQRSLAAVFAVLLAAMIGGCVHMWAQDDSNIDSPIIIADGSLTLESAVAWSRYNSGPNTRVHPHAGKSVTQVVIAMPGHNRTIAFSGQKCTVTALYGSTTVTVTTGNNGRGLQVMTDFSSFHAGATPRHLAHNNANLKISHVTVMQGNQTAFDSAASGGTTITINYRP
jgi:hypothetical protein